MGLHLLPSYIHRIHTGLESWTEETKKGAQLLGLLGSKQPPSAGLEVAATMSSSNFLLKVEISAGW